MKNNILDLDLIEEDVDEAKLVNWVSIILLWVGICLCIINGIMSNYFVILGLVLLIITSITQYFKYEYGAKFTFIIIGFGGLGLLKYFPFDYTISFGLGNLGLKLEILYVFIGVLHYYTNIRVLKRIFHKTLTEEELKKEERERIETYKRGFSKKSIDELNEIMNNEDLLSVARKAAKELITKIESNK